MRNFTVICRRVDRSGYVHGHTALTATPEQACVEAIAAAAAELEVDAERIMVIALIAGDVESWIWNDDGIGALAIASIPALPSGLLPMESGRLAFARRLAARAHVGQFDKSGAPYIMHLGRVAARVCDDQDAEIVGWLHDLREDQPAYWPAVEAAFAGAIADAITLLTRAPGVPDSTYYARIRGNALALRVKLADIDDNRAPERLALLASATAMRLSAKYHNALQMLDADAIAAAVERHGEDVLSDFDVMARLDQGYVLFKQHEMDDDLTEVCGVEELNGYTYDQLIAIKPHHLPGRIPDQLAA